ncbi:MAG: hypothetical protein AVDCRST_MAG73-3137 [uncultured Thermomicrobiales bacterium]|uniref:Uncharacterized protein n=1 Tax=uncultured Thermomicrobiales bacterium TaxID=1645740 RepID=A0A6J4UR06_9BACT|nr:MAG: hypothetical protein AVDCRST_MAG73-3137 [uncultured Thermomicrobiales bacterium]
MVASPPVLSSSSVVAASWNRITWAVTDCPLPAAFAVAENANGLTSMASTPSKRSILNRLAVALLTLNPPDCRGPPLDLPCVVARRRPRTLPPRVTSSIPFLPETATLPRPSPARRGELSTPVRRCRKTDPSTP